MRTPLQLVKEVKGTMAMEGMKLKEQEIHLLNKCASGKVCSKAAVKSLVLKYTQK